MCLLIVLLLGLFGFLGYAGVSSDLSSPPVVVEVPAAVVQVPTQMIACESVPEDVDIRTALALVGEAFPAPEWVQQVSSDASRTTATWRSSRSGAVAHVELLHYDCGVTPDQIKRFYDSTGFDTIFSHYSAHAMTDQCMAGGVRLFEFDVVFDGSDYRTRYWVEQVSPTRVAGIMLTFAAEDQAQMAEYAGLLFPELPTCEDAAG